MSLAHLHGFGPNTFKQTPFRVIQIVEESRQIELHFFFKGFICLRPIRSMEEFSFSGLGPLAEYLKVGFRVLASHFRYKQTLVAYLDWWGDSKAKVFNSK